MKGNHCLVYVVIVLGASTALGMNLKDVVAHPERYEGRHMQLEGIARVPGAFYLFPDRSAAAETNLSQALLIRTDTSTGHGYREFDRQWVRVTGVISSKLRHARIPGIGLLLDQVELLRDRPAPRIKDSMVLGIFQNATNQPLLIELRPHAGGATEFVLKPHDVDVNPLEEGEATAAPALGAKDAPLSKRTIGKPIAKCEIQFRGLLPADYEYSPEWSDERTLYYRVTNDRIELVSASQAKGWAEAAGRKIP
jgi:hypothetical protein